MSGEPRRHISKINSDHVNSSPIPPKKTRHDMFVTRRNGLSGPHVTHVPQLCVNITDSQPVKLANRKGFSVSTKCYSVARPVFFGILSLSTMEVSHHFIRFSPGLLQVNQQAELL